MPNHLRQYSSEARAVERAALRTAPVRGGRPVSGLLVAALVLCLRPSWVAAQIRIGPEFQVNSYTPDYQLYPAIAASGTGDLIVV